MELRGLNMRWLRSSQTKTETTGPTILVNIGMNDSTRGDAKGWQAIGRAMARQNNGHMIYADYAVVQEHFPSVTKESYDHYLGEYLNKLEVKPEVCIGHFCRDSLLHAGIDPSIVQKVDQVNESLSAVYIRDTEIVAHDLTPEVLTEEGEKFTAHYQDVKQPLISVLLVDAAEENQEDFIDRLLSACQHFQEGTIFLCGSRRTPQEALKSLNTKLQTRLDKLNQSTQGGGLNLVSYGLDRNPNAFNPYRGLINKADHFVLWGNSQSMMSEPLMSGKTVHLYDSFEPNRLIKRGAVADFATGATSETRFQTRHFEPINRTEELATVLFEKHKQRLTQLSERGKEDKHFVEIRKNADHFPSIPRKFRKKESFQRACIAYNGCVLKHLPKLARDERCVELALNQNPHAAQFVDPAYFSAEKSKEWMDRTHGAIFQHLPDSVKENFFHENMCTDSHYPLLSCDLETDLNILTAMVKYSPQSLSTVPALFTKHPDLLIELVDQTGPQRLRDAPDEILGSLTLAKALVETHPETYGYFNQEIREHSDILRKAAACKDNLDRFPNKLFTEASENIIEALNEAPELIPYLPADQVSCPKLISFLQNSSQPYLACLTPACRDNRDLVLRSYKNGDNFEVSKLPDSLNKDPEVTFAYFENNLSTANQAQWRGLDPALQALLRPRLLELCPSAILYTGAGEEIKAFLAEPAHEDLIVQTTLDTNSRALLFSALANHELSMSPSLTGKILETGCCLPSETCKNLSAETFQDASLFQQNIINHKAQDTNPEAFITEALSHNPQLYFSLPEEEKSMPGLAFTAFQNGLTAENLKRLPESLQKDCRRMAQFADLARHNAQIQAGVKPDHIPARQGIARSQQHGNPAQG